MCDTKVGISYSSVYFNVITMLSLAENVLYPCMVRDEHLHLFVLYSYQSSYHLLNNHINVFLYYLCLLIFLSFFPSFFQSFFISIFLYFNLSLFFCLLFTTVISRSQGLEGGDAIDSDNEDEGTEGSTSYIQLHMMVPLAFAFAFILNDLFYIKCNI